jgi:U3 small nucleolar ribonucleoprotein component
MACKCAERRAAIVGVIKRPSTALTAAKFVAKTGAQDVAVITSEGTRRVMDYLQRRGKRK